MRRRDTIFGLVALAMPGASVGQDSRFGAGRVAKVAMVQTAAPPAEAVVTAFRDRLSEHGYVEGVNLEVRYFRAKDGGLDSLSEAAREAVAWGPHVIRVSTSPLARVVAKATSSIPIVFARVNDPIETGLLANSVRPGGNLTGVAVHQATLTIKRLELVRELLPRARRVVFMLDRSLKVFSDKTTREVHESARRLGLELIDIDPSTLAGSLPEAFEKAGTIRPDVVVWGAIANLSQLGDTRSVIQIQLDFERKEGIPVVTSAAEAVEAGQLIGLGPSLRHEFRLVADQVVRILRGEQPANMPVEWVNIIELAVNLQTARRMGITVPRSILVRADKVFE